jgi:hypothetical protein
LHRGAFISGSGNVIPRLMTSDSSVDTTLSASFSLPFAVNQRGDSGISQRRGTVSAEGTKPIKNMTFQP